MANIRLFSARACPFAHRSRLVLSHKHVEFELVEIDLKNKPAWFDSRVSGYGKVPAIEHGDTRIWESAVINEYLDEVFPEPALLPTSPSQRAVARIWIDYANSRFAPAFGKLLRAQSSSEQNEARSELVEALAHLEQNGFGQSAGEGPFFFGAQPSLVDFAFYPWFERWAGLAHHRGLQIPAEHQRIARWIAASRKLEAIREHENTAEFYIQRYAAIAAPPRQVQVA
jgi:glutathione S-transferase